MKQEVDLWVFEKKKANCSDVCYLLNKSFVENMFINLGFDKSESCT